MMKYNLIDKKTKKKILEGVDLEYCLAYFTFDDYIEKIPENVLVKRKLKGV